MKRRRLIVSLLGPTLAVLAWSSSGVEAGVTIERGHKAVVSVLRCRGAETRTHAEIVEELVRLGPEHVELWRAWVTGEDCAGFFLVDGAFQPEAWVLVPEAGPALALEVLRRLPSPAVLSDLQGFVERSNEEPAAFLATFVILEALGTVRGLDLFWRSVTILGSDVTEMPRLREQAVRALVAMLTGDASAWTTVTKRLQKPDPIEVELLIEALRRADRPDAHPLLKARLGGGTSSSERLEVLRALAHLERRFPWQCGPELIELLEREMPKLTRDDQFAAIELYGESEDPEAVEPLLRLLADPDARAWRGALAALENLTGVVRGRTADEWKRWHEREVRWGTEEAEGLFEGLRGDPSRVASVLSELSRHPLYRRSVALRLSTGLSALDPRSLRLACELLTTLGSRAALPGLLEHFKRTHDPEQKRCLLAALTSLNGHDKTASLEGRVGFAGE